MQICNQTNDRKSINTHWTISKLLGSKIFYSSHASDSFPYHQQLLFRKGIQGESNALLNFLYLHEMFVFSRVFGR